MKDNIFILKKKYILLKRINKLNSLRSHIFSQYHKSIYYLIFLFTHVLVFEVLFWNPISVELTFDNFMKKIFLMRFSPSIYFLQKRRKMLRRNH